MPQFLDDREKKRRMGGRGGSLAGFAGQMGALRGRPQGGMGNFASGFRMERPMGRPFGGERGGMSIMPVGQPQQFIEQDLTPDVASQNAPTQMSMTGMGNSAPTMQEDHTQIPRPPQMPPQMQAQRPGMSNLPPWMTQANPRPPGMPQWMFQQNPTPPGMNRPSGNRNY